MLPTCLCPLILATLSPEDLPGGGGQHWLVLQRAGLLLLIQLEIINAHSTEQRGIQVPRPHCLYAKCSAYPPCSLWAGLGTTAVPSAYSGFTIKCTCAAWNTSRGANQNLPLTQVMTALPPCSPPRRYPVVALHPALCHLTMSCMAQKPEFPLTKTALGAVLLMRKHLVRRQKLTSYTSRSIRYCSKLQQLHIQLCPQAHQMSFCHFPLANRNCSALAEVRMAKH